MIKAGSKQSGNVPQRHHVVKKESNQRCCQKKGSTPRPFLHPSSPTDALSCLCCTSRRPQLCPVTNCAFRNGKEGQNWNTKQGPKTHGTSTRPCSTVVRSALVSSPPGPALSQMISCLQPSRFPVLGTVPYTPGSPDLQRSPFAALSGDTMTH